MSPLSLPNHASLNSMRREARLLQAGVAARNAHALELVAHHDPDRAGTPTLPLHAAQLVVARAHGFSNWAALKRYFELAAGLQFDGGKPPADEPAADRLCRLATLDYADDGPAHWVAARALLAADPDLVQHHIWAAAAAGDSGAVRAHLARDRTLAGRRGGPHRWSPLYYLVYSRLNTDAAADAVLGTAQLLLDAGADPNEGYLWAGQPPPFTLLTGAFGEGELGPERQPRHPHAQALARLLLRAGADPNDGQTLYNRMFSPADDHLELLFEFGLGRGDGGPWRARLGDAVDSPAGLLRAQLGWAIDHGFPARVRLLLAHGVDPDRALADGRRPVTAALVAGRPEIAALLVTAGAAPPDLDPVEQLVAAALAADRTAVAAILAANPGIVGDAVRRRPGLMVWAAVNGWLDAVRLLAELGFDVNGKGRGDTPIDHEWETPLHQAAGNGDADMVRLLLELGADPTIEDRRFHSTPGGWATHFGHHDVTALLSGASKR